MKRIVCLFLLLAMMASAVVPVFATGYDPNVRGHVSVSVEVPAGFDEIVYLSLMDSAGGSLTYPVLPESDYFLSEVVMSGSYYVSAFVDNDPLMEYTVYRDQDMITVSLENAVHIKLTVTGGPQGSSTETEATVPPETVPPTTPPVTTEPSVEAPSVPTTAPATDPGEETHTEPTPSSDPESDSDATGEDSGNSLLADVLISIFGAIIFVAVVVLIVYLVRRFGDHM